MSQSKSAVNLKGVSDYYTSYLTGTNRENANSVVDYDLWAKTYERDEVDCFGYSIPVFFVDFLEEKMNSDSCFTKSSSVIDIAAGTGLIGEELRKRSFVGQIDAVDGSEKMLEVAKKKEIYQNLYFHYLDPKVPMPEEVPSEFYDILTCCASLHLGHVAAECIKQMFNCVRVGGLIIFTLKHPPTLAKLEYRFQLERECFLLEDQGYWQIVDQKLVKNYRKPMKEAEINHPPSMHLYCYKKLKSAQNPK